MTSSTVHFKLVHTITHLVEAKFAFEGGGGGSAFIQRLHSLFDIPMSWRTDEHARPVPGTPTEKNISIKTLRICGYCPKQWIVTTVNAHTQNAKITVLKPGFKNLLYVH